MEKNETPTIDVTGRGIVTVDLDTTRIELKVVECGSGVNGNQKCSIFGNYECSDFGIKTAVDSATMVQ